MVICIVCFNRLVKVRETTYQSIEKEIQAHKLIHTLCSIDVFSPQQNCYDILNSNWLEVLLCKLGFVTERADLRGQFYIKMCLLLKFNSFAWITFVMVHDIGPLWYKALSSCMIEQFSRLVTNSITRSEIRLGFKISHLIEGTISDHNMNKKLLKGLSLIIPVANLFNVSYRCYFLE